MGYFNIFFVSQSFIITLTYGTFDMRWASVVTFFRAEQYFEI